MKNWNEDRQIGLPHLRIHLLVVFVWLALMVQDAFSLTLYVKSPFSSQQLFIAGNQEFGWWSGRQMVSQGDGWYRIDPTLTTNQGVDVLSVYPDLGRTSSVEIGSMQSIYQQINSGDVAYVSVELNGQLSVSEVKPGTVVISSSPLVSSSQVASSSSEVNEGQSSRGTQDPTINPGEDSQELGTIEADTLYIAYGDSVNIIAQDAAFSEWSSDAEFVKLVDNSIRVSPISTSTYYLNSYARMAITNENSSFELPVTNRRVDIMDQANVPGWRTTAKDGKIEVWKNFSGVTAYDGDQLVELNANFEGDLYQDISTTGGEKIIIEFAHRGRSGPDRLGLKYGPPEGPYTTVGEYTGATDKWTTHQEIINIPLGQATTRIFFTSEGYTNSSVGNLLDAIQYTRAETSSDSVVVVVQYPMDVTTPLAADIFDDGDGIADHLVIDFDANLNDENRFDSVKVFWGTDSTTYSWDDMKVVDDQVILSGVQFSEEIYTGQRNSGDQALVKFYYSDLVFNSGTQIEKTIEINDQVGPVLLEAFLLQGERQLILAKYSEMVQNDFKGEQSDLIIYESKNSDGQEFKYFYQDFDYTRDSLNSEIYQPGNMLSTKDSIRLTINNGVSDMQGNRPHKNNAYVEINYHQVLNVERSNFADVPEFVEGTLAMDLQLVDRSLPVSEISAEIQRVGIRYDLDFKSFLENYKNLDPSLITLQWEMEVFTNQGGFVNRETGSVECYDSIFEGGCLEDDRMMYVGWNMMDANDRKAGSGAYVGRVIMKFTYEDTIITESNELWIFGVKRIE